jgi:hypothetical protein
MATKNTEKASARDWVCQNPKGAYTLWEIVALLKSDRSFAQFSVALLKSANNNEKGAIACVDSYLEPTTGELEDLGIPASQWNSLRKCTDSGLLVAAIALESTGQVRH